MKDTWGVLMRRDSPLARQESVSPRDLWDKPLILSRQVDNKSGLYRWLRKEPSELHTVATYNLIYNASLMVDEGMGYAFTLDKLVNTTGSAPVLPAAEAETGAGHVPGVEKVPDLFQGGGAVSGVPAGASGYAPGRAGIRRTCCARMAVRICGQRTASKKIEKA